MSQTKKKSAHSSSSGPKSDSGNDQNYLSESIENSSSLTLSHSVELSSKQLKFNEQQGLTEEDLKRIEYQKQILSMMLSKKEQKTNEDSSEKQVDTAKLFEDRKKEIQKNSASTCTRRRVLVLTPTNQTL